MNVEFINPFVMATINVLKTMTQTDPKPGKPAIKTDSKTWGEVTGLIGMASDQVVGNMVLSFDRASILGIVKRMLMDDSMTELNQDVIDAVGELTNMISGGAKKDLSERGFVFNMASPVMLVGKSIEMTQLTKVPIISIPFETAEGKFVVEATMHKK